jgi:hypothetical protein
MITTCKNCYFARYEGNTQVGCELNRIVKYENNGYEVIPAYDEEKEFYLIRGFCPFSRSKEWAENYADPELQAREEIKIKTHFIVNFDTGNRDDLKDIIGQLSAQTIMPHTVTVLNHNLDFLNSIIGVLHKGHFDKWRNQNLVAGTTIDEAADLAVDAVADPYFFFIKTSRFNLHPHFVENLNRFLIDDIGSFAGIIGDNFEGYPRILNRYYGGNAMSRLYDKLIQHDLSSKILKFEKFNRSKDEN